MDFIIGSVNTHRTNKNLGFEFLEAPQKTNTGR